MDEENNIKKTKIVKGLKFVIYPLLIILVIGSFLELKIFTNVVDYYCQGVSIGSFVSFLIIFSWILLAVLTTITTFIARRNNIKLKTTLINVILVLVALFFGISMFSFTGCRSLCKEATIKSDFSQIGTAQTLYYDDNMEYAETWEDLSPKYISPIPTNPFNGLPYADADGQGLDGGDDDSQTWEVEAELAKTYYEKCGAEERYIYRCRVNTGNSKAECQEIIE